MTNLTEFERDGLVFDVRDEGPVDGDPIVLLHGFPDGPASWDRVVPDLVASGHRVLVPSQRGYSPRARPAKRTDYRLHQLVADIVALLDAAGLRKVHLVGHDWGGAVAWQFATDYPDRVATLTVFSTPHPRAMLRGMFASTQLLKSWYFLLFQLPGLPERIIRASGGKGFARSLTRSGLDAGRAMACATALADPAAARGALNWYRGMQPTGARQAQPVTVPTWFGWGDEDVALGRYAATHTAEWVQGPYRFEILEGISHWIPEEEPLLAVDFIIGHIGAIGAVAP